MEHLPNKERLTALGVAIYEDGLAAHAEEMSNLVQILSAATPDDVLVAVVADPDAPQIVRLRALARITTNWPKYSTALTAQTRRDFDGAFAELLDAWGSHQELRKSGVPIDELFASRVALDHLRERVGSLRKQLISPSNPNFMGC